MLIDYSPRGSPTIRFEMNRICSRGHLLGPYKFSQAFRLRSSSSTVNVDRPAGRPTVPADQLLRGTPRSTAPTVTSRTSEYVQAVRANQAPKLIFCALLDRSASAFLALDALRERLGLSVVDAISGTSLEAHRAGLERFVQAGGRSRSAARSSRSPASYSATGRAFESLPRFVELVLTDRSCSDVIGPTAHTRPAKQLPPDEPVPTLRFHDYHQGSTPARDGATLPTIRSQLATTSARRAQPT